jgi:riboflavin kinase/FMN adenylyltransferase
MAMPHHPIQRITRLADLPERLRGGVVAIGNFDGVHRGHQAVLGPTLEQARQRGLPALVLTFEPHPRAVFAPADPLFRITPAPMKARLLELLGFYAVVEHPFTREFSRLTADDFVGRVLVEGLGVSHAVTGFDFHFGRDRQGDPAYLEKAGAQEGFSVTLVDAFGDENAEVISSSRIRDHLEAGEVVEAAGLLGYRFTVEAPVASGKRLGRELGFPTANMALPAETALRHGIYAVRFRAADGSLHDGVASFGRRPTIDADGAPLLETFLFNFDDDLYGQTCAVSFFGFLRGEEKFDGLDALVAQMKRDEAETKALLSGVRPLGELDARVAF